MPRPIVLGYDGSACSAAALDEAVELVRDATGAVVVYERRVELEVRPMLDRAADKVRAAGIETEVLLVWDEPVRALEDVARRRGSHVIVVGSHGEGPIAGALGRHTPFELLHRSEIPVLVVPHRR
jgi:nucleotide-binding universal stress UspA family protein